MLSNQHTQWEKFAVSYSSCKNPGSAPGLASQSASQSASQQCSLVGCLVAYLELKQRLHDSSSHAHKIKHSLMYIYIYKQLTADSNNSSNSFQFPEVNILSTGRRGLEGLRPEPIDTRREMGSFRPLLRQCCWIAVRQSSLGLLARTPPSMQLSCSENLNGAADVQRATFQTSSVWKSL